MEFVEPHRHRAPLLEELARPVRRGVFSEKVEVLLERVSAHGAQVGGAQLFGLEGLKGGEILDALEPTQTRVGQHYARSAEAISRLGLGSLLGAHFIDDLVHLGGDVMASEGVEGAGGPFGYHVEVRLSQVRAEDADLGAALSAEPQEQPAESGLLAALREEEEPFPAFVNLANGRGESALAAVDLVDPAAGGDTRQVREGTMPVGSSTNEAIHALFASLEGPRDLLPGQQLYPGAQKSREIRRQRLLARRPRQFLDADAELATTHTARRDAEVGQDTARAPRAETATRAAPAFVIEGYSGPYFCEFLRV